MINIKLRMVVKRGAEGDVIRQQHTGVFEGNW